jgi:peptidoglycan/xylan/chitin deacetylase (PgdA/CDA1 family)
MPRRVKQGILQAAEFFGVNKFFRDQMRSRLLGLCYHGVIGDDAPMDDPRTRIAVTKSQFEAQLAELRNHWTPIALSEIDRCFRNGEPIPEQSVFVTFDDGFLNNLNVAAPILKKYEIPATVFLTTGLIETNDTIWPLELVERIVAWYGNDLPLPNGTETLTLPTEPRERIDAAVTVMNRCKSLSNSERIRYVELIRGKTVFQPSEYWQYELYRLMIWEDARQLREMGFEFGAHTISHCNLAKLPIDEAIREIRESKERIETELGAECFALAYPFGDRSAFSDTVINAAKNLGFRIGVTLCMHRNPMQPDPMRLDRICVTGDTTLASFRSLIAGWRGN